MKPEAVVQRVFGRFQNLNLVVLLHDLRLGRVTWGEWLLDDLMCPVAHGLSNGRTVVELRKMSQAVDLPHACEVAARDLEADSTAVILFVELWDEGRITAEWLSEQLRAMWQERLEDAVAVQQVIVSSNVLQAPLGADTISRVAIPALA